MKLLRLEMKRFGRFEDQTIDFADGINLIFGNNESGKTTVAEALCTVLFDDPAHLPASLSRYSNWRSEHPFLLHLEYESSGKNFRLTKDVSTELSLLEEVESGTRWNTYKDVQEQVNKAVGFSEREFFEATAFLRQGELANTNRHANLIKDKLERLMNSNKDEVLASRLLDKLSKRVGELEGTPTEPGEIGQWQKRVAGWETEFQTSKSKTAELLETRKRLYANSVEIKESQSKFDEKHDRFKKSKLAFEAAQSLDKERELHLDLARKTREAQDIKNAISTKKENLKSQTKIERSELKTCESLATQKTIFEGKIRDLESRLEREREILDQTSPGGWYKYILGFGVVAVLGCVIAYSQLQDKLFLAAAGAATVVVAASITLWISGKRSYTSAQSKFDETKSNLDGERETLRKNVETLDALLRRFKVKDVDELAEYYEQYRDLDRDMKSMVSRYEMILGENNLKDLEVDLAALTERMNEQTKIFEQHRAYSISAQGLEQLQREVAELDKKLSKLQEEATVLTHKLEFLESGTDIMAPLQERIEEGKRKLVQYKSESEQLKIVARYLEEARRKVLKTSMEMLETQASSYLAALTAGTWTHLRLDRQQLDCEISLDGNHWHKPETMLSRGAVDSLYIALRMALVRVLSNGNRPPLVMEDPLVNLDRIRRVEAERLIREISRDYQVIYLAADQHYHDLADRVIDLNSSVQQGSRVSVA